MLKVFDFIKKMTGNAKTEAAPPIKEEENKDKLFDKIHALSGFVSNKFQEATEEYSVIKEKAKDLSATNYNLGMKHLQNGNLSEAIFRFKIIKKFWPNNHDAYYQLAYCLVLSNKLDKAEEIIKELLQKDPSYEEKIMTLLSSIDEARNKASDNIVS